MRDPTVSGHIKAMESAGLVKRDTPDPEDRRRNGLVARELMQLPPQGLDAPRKALLNLNEISE